MNSLLLLIIGLPILEIMVMIKIGQQLGAFNTVLLIIFTAVIGIYFARIQGLNTLRSGFVNLYQNKTPINEMISGASIAIAAFFLIIPGFITDAIGFFLLLPLTRNILINYFIKKNNFRNKNDIETDILDGEIIDKKKEDKDEI